MSFSRCEDFKVFSDMICDSLEGVGCLCGGEELQELALLWRIRNSRTTLRFSSGSTKLCVSQDILIFENLTVCLASFPFRGTQCVLHPSFEATWSTTTSILYKLNWGGTWFSLAEFLFLPVQMCEFNSIDYNTRARLHTHTTYNSTTHSTTARDDRRYSRKRPVIRIGMGEVGGESKIPLSLLWCWPTKRCLPGNSILVLACLSGCSPDTGMRKSTHEIHHVASTRPRVGQWQRWQVFSGHWTCFRNCCFCPRKGYLCFL